MKNHALIPAKEKSTRCVNKNWRSFLGEMNLVTYLLSTIPEDFFDSVILSTDKKDVTVPEHVTLHRRDQSLATEQSPVNDLISQVIAQYLLDDEDFIWLLNPTSPFRQRTDFFAVRDILHHYTSLISISSVHPFVWRDGEPLFETAGSRKNTQDLRTEYGIENGQFIVFKTGEFKRSNTWYSRDLYLFKQSSIESFFDIDTEEDFHAAQDWARARFSGETLANETLQVELMIREPIGAHTRFLYSHFRRYALAVRLLEIDRSDLVIDASCGSGYGSFILSLTAGNVIGLDVNKDYLAKASQLYSGGNISFIGYDDYEKSENWRSQRAHKIVCIETLEHMPKAEMEQFIGMLFRYLNPGGDIFMTVPIGKNQPSNYNRFHLNEPSIGALYDLCNERFRKLSFEVEEYLNTFGHAEKYCVVVMKSFKETTDEI